MTTARVSRAAYSADFGCLGSDMVEKRALDPAMGFAGGGPKLFVSEQSLLSPKLSNTCTTSSSAANSPSSQDDASQPLNVQEVRICYMRQDDALSAAPCFDSTSTKFPLAGAVSLNHRNKEPLSAPYKVRNGKVHFEAGEYLQIVDAPQRGGTLGGDVATEGSENIDKKTESQKYHYYTIPLKVETSSLARVEATPSATSRQLSQRYAAFRHTRFFSEDKNNSSSVDATEAVGQQRRPQYHRHEYQRSDGDQGVLPADAFMNHHFRQNQRQTPKQYSCTTSNPLREDVHHRGFDRSASSNYFEDDTIGIDNVGKSRPKAKAISTSTTRTIYQRTTSEVTTNRLTTTTFEPLVVSGPAQNSQTQYSAPHCAQSPPSAQHMHSRYRRQSYEAAEDPYPSSAYQPHNQSSNVVSTTTTTFRNDYAASPTTVHRRTPTRIMSPNGGGGLPRNVQSLSDDGMRMYKSDLSDEHIRFERRRQNEYSDARGYVRPPPLPTSPPPLPVGGLAKTCAPRITTEFPPTEPMPNRRTPTVFGTSPSPTPLIDDYTPLHQERCPNRGYDYHRSSTSQSAPTDSEFRHHREEYESEELYIAERTKYHRRKYRSRSPVYGTHEREVVNEENKYTDETTVHRRGKSGDGKVDRIIERNVPIVTARPTNPNVVSSMRLIDYDTYKREVEQLKRAAAMSAGGTSATSPLRVDVDPPIPLTPAIVVCQPEKIDRKIDVKNSVSDPIASTASTIVRSSPQPSPRQTAKSATASSLTERAAALKAQLAEMESARRYRRKEQEERSEISQFEDPRLRRDALFPTVVGSYGGGSSIRSCSAERIAERESYLLQIASARSATEISRKADDVHKENKVEERSRTEFERKLKKISETPRFRPLHPEAHTVRSSETFAEELRRQRERIVTAAREREAAAARKAEEITKRQTDADAAEEQKKRESVEKETAARELGSGQEQTESYRSVPITVERSVRETVKDHRKPDVDETSDGERRTRRIKEIETEELAETLYQHLQPLVELERKSWCMEQRELHAFQEEMQRGLSAEGDGVASPPSSPHRRPIYVEKATQRSVDIAIENVTLPRQQQMEAADANKIRSSESAVVEHRSMIFEDTASEGAGVAVAPLTRTTTTTAATSTDDTLVISERLFGDGYYGDATTDADDYGSSAAVGDSTRTTPRPSVYTDAGTQFGGPAAEFSDAMTDAAPLTPPPPRQDAETQMAEEEITTNVSGRELLETLRRELQYEELIDLEVRKRQRVFRDDGESNVSEGGGGAGGLDTVDEEAEINDSKAEDRGETGSFIDYGSGAADEAEVDELVDTEEPQIIEDAAIAPLNIEGHPHAAELHTNSVPQMVEPSGDASIAEVAALADADPIKSIVGSDEEEERTFEETIEYESKTVTERKTPSSATTPLLTSPLPPSPAQQSSFADLGTTTVDQQQQQFHSPSSGAFSPVQRPQLQPQTTYTTRATTRFSPTSPRAVSTAEIRLQPSPKYHQQQPLVVTSRHLPPPPPPPAARSTMDYGHTSEYRSNISTRQNYNRPMHRTVSPTPASHRVLKMVSETSSMSSGPFSPYAGSTAASTIRDAREREKKDLSDLNDRLASYIEKVRFLEAQNRKLSADLDFLRQRWGKDTTSIRDMYEGDIKEAHKLIDETNRQRNELEEQIKRLEEEIMILRRKYEELEKQHYLDKEKIDELLLKLSALEAEIALLKRRIAILEEDVNAVKRENHRLLNDLQHARNEVDQETLNRIDYQNQVQTLIEEIDFLRRAHDSEIQDLQAMASRDTTSENREFFRNELASAIRDIREEYDKVCNVQRVDMESWYKLKVQEIQTQSNRQTMEQSYAKEEVRRLRVQLGDLRGKLADLEGRNSLLEKQAEELNYQLEDDQRSYETALNDRDSAIRKIRDECQMLMVELQMLLDTKQTLDAEIAIYRKMLEGEEDRAGLRQLVEQVVRTHQLKQSDESESVRVLRGETSSRNSYQRSAKGNVSIWEASPDGRYIVVENTHRSRAENIGEWKLRRRIDGRREVVFTFPPNFQLAPGKAVKIWARNQGPHNPPDELVFDREESFGVGHNVHTVLYNTKGEERATLIQRSSAAPATTH